MAEFDPRSILRTRVENEHGLDTNRFKESLCERSDPDPHDLDAAHACTGSLRSVWSEFSISSQSGSWQADPSKLAGGGTIQRPGDSGKWSRRE